MRQTWEDFRDSGLLWWINRILHTFGWAICFEFEDGKIEDVYPAKVEYRGFSEESEAEGFQKMKDTFIKE